MIKSILDTDLYKFTMQQAVLEKYPKAIAEYGFKSRRSTPINKAFRELFTESVHDLCKLKLTSDEADFLREQVPFLKPSYLEYLRNYKFDYSDLSYVLTDDLATSRIVPVCPWHKGMLWEVPLMAIISETYFKTVDTDWTLDGQAKKARDKALALQNAGCLFSDFGTRRRRSHEVQDLVVENLKVGSTFTGTSNVYFAKEHGLRPIGTMAHEWIMGVSALESLKHANRYALHAWNDVYQGDLGIALTDTFGTKAFFDDFDGVLARLFDGVRHDSADPFEFATKVVAFYKKSRINYAEKTIVFSDSLNVTTCIALLEHCRKLGIKCVFGIGTHFTNDFDGSPALNMVIKLRSLANDEFTPFVQVVKLSDDLGKATGEADALRVAKYVFFGTPLDA